jgi:hypothetical protein
MLAGELTLPGRGRMPPDRMLARFCVVATAALTGWLAVEALWKKTRQRVQHSTP